MIGDEVPQSGTWVLTPACVTAIFRSNLVDPCTLCGSSASPASGNGPARIRTRPQSRWFRGRAWGNATRLSERLFAWCPSSTIQSRDAAGNTSGDAGAEHAEVGAIKSALGVAGPGVAAHGPDARAADLPGHRPPAAVRSAAGDSADQPADLGTKTCVAVVRTDARAAERARQGADARPRHPSAEHGAEPAAERVLAEAGVRIGRVGLHHPAVHSGRSPDAAGDERCTARQAERPGGVADRSPGEHHGGRKGGRAAQQRPGVGVGKELRVGRAQGVARTLIETAGGPGDFPGKTGHLIRCFRKIAWVTKSQED